MSAPSECPPDDAFARFVAGDLSGDEREQLLEHADNCEICHELLAVVLRGPGPSPEDDTLPNVDGKPPPPRPKAGDRIEHYVVVDIVGAGAMGVVLHCRDTSLGRDVALKLLNRAPDRQYEQRLIREAQALAQLTHPNVVTVHAVFRHEGSVYVAMEYVQGRSLRRWCEAKRRPWSEVLKTFLQAGQGLAAAHSEGLVHRDFKPDNVLVSDDDRVLVTDFGLAAVTPQTDTPSSVDWSEPLTKTGTALGTPRFMAPEQIRGDAVEPRADQFSFAVALYHGLYRRFPFKGATIEELAINIRRDGPTPPPAETPVPAAVWETLRRSLSYEPSDRFETMGAMLAQLDVELQRRRQRRKWYVVAAVGVAGIGGGAVIGGLIGGPPCRDLGRRLDGIWDDARRTELSSQELAGPVAERLDAYAKQWSTTAREICLATHEQKVQSEELLEARMHCLDDAARSLDALVAILANRDDASVRENAAVAADHLPDLSACARARPHGSEISEENEERLARLSALSRLGLYAEAETLGKSIIDEAPSPRARALARLAVANLYLSSGKRAEATAVLERAGLEAAEAVDDEAIARVWMTRARHALSREDYGEAQAHYDAAKVAVRRVGDPAALRFVLEVIHGDLLHERGDHLAAIEVYDKALAAAAETGSILNKAAVLSRRSLPKSGLGRMDEAVSDARSALDVRLKALGELHPHVLSARIRVAQVLVAAGRHAEARPELQKSFDAAQKRFGTDSPSTAIALAGLAAVDLELGDLARAVDEGERTLALLERMDVPDPDKSVNALVVLAHAYSLQERYDLALARADAALERERGRLGDDHPSLVVIYLARGEVLRRKGDHAAALPDFERALALSPNPSMPAAFALTGIGMCKSGLDQAGAAAVLEDALKMHERFSSDATDRAETAFALAQAIASHDPERATRLAREARDILTAPGSTKIREQVEAFLAGR